MERSGISEEMMKGVFSRLYGNDSDMMKIELKLINVNAQETIDENDGINSVIRT